MVAHRLHFLSSEKQVTPPSGSSLYYCVPSSVYTRGGTNIHQSTLLFDSRIGLAFGSGCITEGKIKQGYRSALYLNL